MTKDELINRLQDIEWEDFEVKEARSALPKNIWETVSAFANTSGGWIVLGVKQNGKVFEIQGVENIEKLEQDFAGAVRSQKFNIRLSFSMKRHVVEGKNVLAIHIPSSVQKPVYFGNRPIHLSVLGVVTSGLRRMRYWPCTMTNPLALDRKCLSREHRCLRLIWIHCMATGII